MIRNLGTVDAGACLPSTSRRVYYFPFSPTTPTTMFKLLPSMCPLKFLGTLQKNLFLRATLGFIINNHYDKFLKPRKSIRYQTQQFIFQEKSTWIFSFFNLTQVFEASIYSAGSFIDFIYAGNVSKCTLCSFQDIFLSAPFGPLWGKERTKKQGSISPHLCSKAHFMEPKNQKKFSEMTSLSPVHPVP